MKRLALVLLLCILLCACTPSQPSSPPESILYLGGAAILDEFEVTGGPGDSDGGSDIVIRTPAKLEREGFHFAVVGTTEDGTQHTLFTEADIMPASYFVIREEEYGEYTELTLFMDYTWNGTLMSMRAINLFILEEQSSVAVEFGSSD